MIDSFIESWELFAPAYLAGWFAAIFLSLTGVVVVARNQIFIGAAVSQASTLGIALAMGVGALLGARAEWLESDVFLTTCATALSVLAAFLTEIGGGEGRESREAITGWVFLLAGSVSILVVSYSPHGMEEIHQLLFSSIIGATWTDVAIFGALAGATAVAAVLLRRKLLLLLLDPQLAALSGLRVRLWGAATATWIGLAIGLSMRVTGMLFTFGCLVLPGVAAKSLARETGSVAYIAPLLALIASAAAFVLANHYDFPPGQLAVALLCLTVLVAWLTRRVRTRLGGA